MSPSAERTAARRGRVGFSVVLLVLLCAVAAFAIWRQRNRRGELATPPAISDPEQEVPGLSGRSEASGGGFVAARLSALHADPDRQRFDADALRRQLDLPRGEPWRLELRWREPVGAARAAEDSASELELGDLVVVDAQGVALQPIGDAAPRAADAPANPLRTLLAPPRDGLAPGEAVELVLWGRAPGAGARIEGFPVPDAAGQDGLAGPLRLEAAGLRRSELDDSLARLERPTGDDRDAAPTGPVSGPGEER